MIVITGCFNDTVLVPQLTNLSPYFSSDYEEYDFKLIFPTPTGILSEEAIYELASI